MDVEATLQREREVGGGQYSVASRLRTGGSQSVFKSVARPFVGQSVGRPFSQSFIQSAIRAGPWLTRCRCDVNAMPERVLGEDLLARNVNAAASGPSYSMF